LLREGGALAVASPITDRALSDRVRVSMTIAFKRPPLMMSRQVSGMRGEVYVSGAGIKAGHHPMYPATPLTDDWPFSHLRDPWPPPAQLVPLGIATTLLLLLLGVGRRRVDEHAFSLGAGASLLAAYATAVLATSSSARLIGAPVLVAAIGLALLGALISVHRARTRAGVPWLYYAVMVGSLGLHIVMPDAALHLLGFSVVAGTAILTTSLRRVDGARYMLGAVLAGAATGGLVTHITLFTGLVALLLLGGLCVLVAMRADLRTRHPRVRV